MYCVLVKIGVQLFLTDFDIFFVSRVKQNLSNVTIYRSYEHTVHIHTKQNAKLNHHIRNNSLFELYMNC